ncbi:hypothetical protein EIP86_003562 [Pleurotus ostreatoroseus]|nr:hypothetical protein EIP86_003562 [Pleurotus ostreatoroseus]
MTVEDVQDLHNLLRDSPQLFAEFARFLLPSHIFSLSRDVEQTQLTLVEQDEKLLQRRISSGCADASLDRRTLEPQDTHLFHLLSSALQREEEQRTIIRVLRGGDAQYALLVLQWLLEVESCWSRFVALAPKGGAPGFGGEDWQRAQTFLVKLAASNDQVPPSLRLDGLYIDRTLVRGSFTTDVFAGRYKGNKVAVKVLCVFGTVLGPSQAEEYRRELKQRGKPVPCEKWNNVLINKDYGVMLCDFDFRMTYLATAFREAVSDNILPDTTPRWYAPEYWLDASTAADWSGPRLSAYEACRLRIYSGEPPQFRRLKCPLRDESSVIPAIVLRGARPLRPRELKHDGLWAIIQGCWSSQPHDRPSIVEVVQQLRTLLPEFPPAA